MGVRENKDIFLGEVWGGVQVGVKKRRKGRAPPPNFIRAARGEAWAKKNL
jgi:hypothetical protein